MRPARTLRAVLFDLDGTFADTFPDLAGALAAAMAERGLAGAEPAELRPLVSRGARAMAEHACAGALGADALDALLERFLDLYHADVARHTRLVDGMPEVVAALRRRDIPWGIVTNKRHRWTEPLMAALDPGGHAACVVSGDSTANAKPHPQPLLHACRLLGHAPAACVYVGDAENDVVAAHRAGMPCLVARWGYLAPQDDPARWRADAVIDAPGDLLAWMDGS